jgi:PucR C-terminal helix-turn-helix domain/GGDEF-like domain
MPAVAQRLRLRRVEMEEAILTRLLAGVPEEGRYKGDEAGRGRREAVRACLDLVLLTIEDDSAWDDQPLVPPAAVMQVRRVAQSGLPVATVLEAYIDGYSVLWDFVLEEVQRAKVSEEERGELLRMASVRLSSMTAQLLPIIAATHARETSKGGRSLEQRTAAIVEGLLKNSLVNTDELGYDVEGSHVGVIANGSGAAEVLRVLAAKLDRRLLRVPREDGVIWAWLGGKERICPSRVPDLGEIANGVRLAVGEPASGREGFRGSHRQAQLAMQVAIHQSDLLTRYADVLLLVPAVQDEQCGDSLISIYLSPLEESRERTPTLKDTLQAYFEAERNTSATAARLKVDRRTAMTRLRTVEERLGFPIYKRHAELEVALRLDHLRRSSSVQGG